MIKLKPIPAPTTTLEYALVYASFGWSVFPVYGISDRVCDCYLGKDCARGNAGKHPIISNGILGAVKNMEIIKQWWTRWPNANIGIATGRASGLIVIDIDTGGELPIKNTDIPDTLETITGSGGRHILLKRPDDDKKYKTCTHVYDNVDSRADGGYIVAPPSNHISGNTYDWDLSGDPFEGAQLANCPEWWLKEIKERKRVSIIGPVINVEFLPDNIEEILEHIPADNYDIWWKVGLIIYRCDPAGLGLFDWWSQKSQKYDEKAVIKKWDSYRGNTRDVQIGMGTLRQMGEAHGWTDSAIISGREIASNLIKSDQRRQAELIKLAKEHNLTVPEIKKPELMPSDNNNLICRIANKILIHSMHKQPDLAIAAAISLIGAISGQKYETETGLRSNVYMIGLAEPSSGKDWARKVINNILQDCKAGEYLGGDDVTAGSAFMTAMSAFHSRLFLLDEFGQWLAKVKEDKAKKDIMKVLLQFYSSANSVFRGTEYTNQKERPRIDIIEPNLVIYGTSNHEDFYKSLSSSEAVNGTMARLLFVEAGTQRPKADRDFINYAKDPSLCDAVNNIIKHRNGGNLDGISTPGAKTMKTKTVWMTKEVKNLFFDLDDYAYSLGTGTSSRSIYGRVAQNASKLSLIYAIAQDYINPRIDLDAFAWGRDFAFYSANQIVSKIKDHVSDNEVEGNYKKVMVAIKNSKDRTINRNVLQKNAGRAIKLREFNEILTKLKESELIVEENYKSSEKAKKSVKRYIYVGE